MAVLCIERRYRQSLLNVLMLPRRGTKGTSTVSSLCLLCLFVAGCTTPASVSITVTPEIAPQPPRVGQAMIMLRVADASGRALTGARVKLEGNMSHAGMTPVFADAAEVEPGRYRANIELSMAGDWIVLVHLTLPDGAKAEREFEIKGVAPA